MDWLTFEALTLIGMSMYMNKRLTIHPYVWLFVCIVNA